jgi:hypothetical protein
MCDITVCTLFLSTRWDAAVNVMYHRSSAFTLQRKKFKPDFTESPRNKQQNFGPPCSPATLWTLQERLMRTPTDWISVPFTSAILINLWPEMSRNPHKYPERVNFLGFEFHVKIERKEKRELTDVFIWSWEKKHHSLTRFRGFAHSPFWWQEYENTVIKAAKVMA